MGSVKHHYDSNGKHIGTTVDQAELMKELDIETSKEGGGDFGIGIKGLLLIVVGVIFGVIGYYVNCDRVGSFNAIGEGIKWGMAAVLLPLGILWYWYVGIALKEWFEEFIWKIEDAFYWISDKFSRKKK